MLTVSNFSTATYTSLQITHRQKKKHIYVWFKNQIIKVDEHVLYKYVFTTFFDN